MTEYCLRPDCAAVKAKVVWISHEKPYHWSEKCCEVCGFRYAGIFCPYIPDDVLLKNKVIG